MQVLQRLPPQCLFISLFSVLTCSTCFQGRPSAVSSFLSSCYHVGLLKILGCSLSLLGPCGAPVLYQAATLQGLRLESLNSLPSFRSQATPKLALHGLFHMEVLYLARTFSPGVPIAGVDFSTCKVLCLFGSFPHGGPLACLYLSKDSSTANWLGSLSWLPQSYELLVLPLA